MANTPHLTIRCDTQLMRRIDRMAKLRGYTRTAYIKVALGRQVRRVRHVSARSSS